MCIAKARCYSRTRTNDEEGQTNLLEENALKDVDRREDGEECCHSYSWGKLRVVVVV